MQQIVTHMLNSANIIFGIGEPKNGQNGKMGMPCRLPFAHPNSGEGYYLRMLPTIVHCAKSFEELGTIDGTEYAIFREACLALGLVADNSEWDDALFKASTWATGVQL